MSGLPAIDRSMLPADIRQGSQADQQRYTAALSFERQLVEQLSKQLSETTKPAGDDDQQQQGSAATEHYRQMLPGILADAVAQGGGLGLARGLYDSMKQEGTGS